METVVTLLIVAGAGFFLLRWLRGVYRGEGCGCGKCGHSLGRCTGCEGEKKG